jgi:hypothetical protein
MTDEQPFLAGPRLSTVAGLRKAGVLQSFHFDPLAGLVGRLSLDWETPAALLERGDDERVMEILVRVADGNFG